MEEASTAVLFIDVSGSTAFYDRYGEVAGRQMVKRCFDVIVPQLTKYGGRIVKTMGDGILVVFPSALELVEGVRAAHISLADYNDSQPEAARIRIHSGGHVGVAVSDTVGDVFGDVVNVAARVEGVAGPDQIYVTADVVRELPESFRENTRAIGRFPLRGKGEELELHEVMWKFEGATMVVSRSALREQAHVALFYAGEILEMGPDVQRLTIGRVAGNDLVVEDSAVSREHAQVIRRKGSIFLVDRSTNGTHLRPELGRIRHLHREEALLEAAGEFTLGRPDGPAISYKVS